MSAIPDRVKSGAVYFIASVTNEGRIDRIKIGHSADPSRRWSELERKHKDRFLNLLAEIPGDLAYERALHARFADDALGHEWFRPTAALVDFMYAADHFDHFHTPDLCAPAPCAQCRKVLRFYSEVAA